MEAVNDASRLIAQALKILREMNEFDADKWPYSKLPLDFNQPIKLLDEAMEKLITKI